MEGNRIPVLVTTSHRGVFFGYADPDQVQARTITLTRCRNCIYWSSDVRGFLGLAEIGPNKNCRLGRQAALPVVLHDVTSVSQCTPEAADQWNAAA